jgi:hypothetical protein
LEFGVFLQLAVEEEEVWRAVLAWAKNQAGVTQPTAHWAEEERARVCQHLSGVINHVRLLLIGTKFKNNIQILYYKSIFI